MGHVTIFLPHIRIYINRLFQVLDPFLGIDRFWGKGNMLPHPP